MLADVTIEKVRRGRYLGKVFATDGGVTRLTYYIAATYAEVLVGTAKEAERLTGGKSRMWQ